VRAEEARFEVEVAPEEAIAFARLSGDWNPLHTDPEHARGTPYRRPVLHGAFSAGLVSRLAGMHLPGRNCLLHSMRLRFVAPIVPPAALVVSGRLVSDTGEVGRVEASVTDARTGARYVDADYEFGRHERVAAPPSGLPVAPPTAGEAAILVTGATGGLGSALRARLGARAVGVSRRAEPGLIEVPDPEAVAPAVAGRRLGAIVHCAWPAPDNARLLDLASPASAVDHHVAAPLRQMLALARLLDAQGTEDAILVLIGSTAAQPGRHNYRMPLYTLGKALVPDLARILAVELGGSGRRCAAVVFDVVEAGMNQRLSRGARVAHADRSPSGRLPSAAEAADQLAWVLENRSSLLSGATLTLSGGALP
jgi:acyl dehydratase/NAD(P)-dependent dehydrogenase (short-subunit alcohol dehydrogenase family)